MTRYIVITIFCLTLIAILAVFLIQPGRYQQTPPPSQSTQTMQMYLSRWQPSNKIRFADCMLTKSDDDLISQAEAHQCLESVESGQ